MIKTINPKFQEAKTPGHKKDEKTQDSSKVNSLKSVIETKRILKAVRRGKKPKNKPPYTQKRKKRQQRISQIQCKPEDNGHL